MRHRPGRLLRRSGILHGIRRDVVSDLEKNHRELTVKGTERLASKRRWADPRRVRGMTIACLKLSLSYNCDKT